MTKLLLIPAADLNATQHILETYKEVGHPYLSMTIRPKPQIEMCSTYKKLVKRLGLKAEVDNKTPLVKQFEQHNVVLGCISTVLIEAMLFGKPVGAYYSLERDNETFLRFFREGPMLLIDSKKKLVQFLKMAGDSPYDEL